ncbi:MAG: alpha-mannosidase [Clostridiales bacterium]|nr:alpha-mannosidase [Clostridiales bacterium]
MDKGEYKIHLIGNAHIDPVWLWRWQEGYAEIKATFRSALDRLREFPDFIFTSACASYYKWIEENEPDMFEEIKERVREGRWAIVGGMWLQPDCNIPSGESFVRHVLYSQRYFMEKFGKMAKVGYNVDSFGHNGTLPQILKKSGMDYYVFMRPGDHEKELPGNVFWWESPDGSRVLAFKIPFAYNSRGKDAVVEKIRRTNDLAEAQGIDFMCFYGVGNHGGGPTIANLKAIQEIQKQDGGDRYIFSCPERYFKAVEEKACKLPVVRDDLQHHASGCYSANWQIKADNRKAEHRLMSAEKFATLACHMLNYPYPGRDLQAAWEKVMFNQFHDIMGGCCIKEAFDDAREFHGWALHTGAWILNGAIQKISWAIDTMTAGAKRRSKENHWYLWEYDDMGTPFVVFNPLSWEVKSTVQVNSVVKGITDEKGNPIPIQIVRGPQTNGQDKWNTLFEAVIPAFGYRVYWVYLNKEFEGVGFDGSFDSSSDSSEAEQMKPTNVLENSYIRLELEQHTGYIKSLYDKINDVEVFKGRGAVSVVIDIHHCDTWAHGIFEFNDEIGRFTDAKIKLMESGPLRWILRVTSRYNDSTLRQDFIIYRDKAEVEVRVKLDWREKHKMLKLSFPVNVEEPTATYEIPYGFIQRPTNGEEEPGQQWIDVTGKAGDKLYGLSILNDSKYSFSILDNDMRMTVANSSIIADHFGARDEWREFLDQGVQEFSYVLVPHPGDWRDVRVVKRAYELNIKPVGIMETYHEGPLPQAMEGIRISADNIIATVFKRAENDDGYILRCYETSGVKTRAGISVPILKREWEAEFGQCEIKTFWIPDDSSKEVVERNLLEQ